MQSKVLIIQQAFGLGDIIWGQTIANDFIKEGYKVLWPVMPSLYEGLNRAYPKVVFVPQTMVGIDYENKEFVEQGGIMMLPMRYSESLMKKQYRFHMESKYSYLGKDWRRWKEHAMPVRDKKREEKLAAVLDLKKGERYNLAQIMYGTDGKHRIALNLNNGMRNIYIDIVPWFSLFDWCGIIENATIIHAVSSSSLYLFELLDLQAEQVHLYPRKPIESDFRYTEFLFSKKYILHE